MEEWECGRRKRRVFENVGERIEVRESDHWGGTGADFWEWRLGKLRLGSLEKIADKYQPLWGKIEEEERTNKNGFISNGGKNKLDKYCQTSLRRLPITNIL